jgi:hypothetical protein
MAQRRRASAGSAVGLLVLVYVYTTGGSADILSVPAPAGRAGWPHAAARCPGGPSPPRALHVGELRLRGGRGSKEAAATGSANAARGEARARTSALRAPRAGFALAREPGLRGGVEKRMVEKRGMAGTVAPEVFESEGLQFRRTTDDAKELLHQMREGGLGDDPLERAREYMDSDEVDDWGAMYDDEDSGWFPMLLFALWKCGISSAGCGCTGGVRRA